MACLPSKMSGPGGCCYHPPGPTQPLLQGAVMPKNHTQTPRAAQAEVEYRDIPGFPGYRVGSDGSIWSNCGTGLNRGTVPWAQKKLHADGGGYPKASFCVGGKSFRRRVHRAVLEAFVGPAPPGAVCRHLDGNPVNNRLENLAWGTHAENCADADRHGTSARGERHPGSKLNCQLVRYIRQRYAEAKGDRAIAPPGTATALANELGVHVETVKQVARRVLWKHC
jgi:hypothetical protein